MNETISLLLATSVLALGGLGLFMYKSTDDKKGGGYDENEIFGNQNDEDGLSEEELDYEPKPRTRNGGKTKRSRKGTGTKRRY